MFIYLSEIWAQNNYSKCSNIFSWTIGPILWGSLFFYFFNFAEPWSGEQLAIVGRRGQRNKSKGQSGKNRL
jgi:hypothetical protein